MENTTDMFSTISYQLQGPVLGIILGTGVGAIIGLGICILYISFQSKRRFLKLKVLNPQTTRVVHITRFLGIFMIGIGCLLLVVLASIYIHDTTFLAFIITSVSIALFGFLAYFFLERLIQKSVNGNK